MRLVLVGPPGSGKGTQAELLARRLGLRYVGTGVILREAIAQGTPTGKLAEPYIRSGQLVPDEVVNELVADLFLRERPQRLVLDGYPRTLAQAVSFDALLRQLCLALDAVVHLVIDEDEVVRRLAGRWTCSNPDCGATYHSGNNPPKVPGVCDRCGSPLTQRPDDREETIRARLKVFRESTADLLDHYRRAGLLREVSASDPIETVYRNILRATGN